MDLVNVEIFGNGRFYSAEVKAIYRDFSWAGRANRLQRSAGRRQTARLVIGRANGGGLMA